MEVAKSLGADHTLLVGKEDTQTLASEIGSKLGGQPNITIECSGAESSVRLGIFVCNRINHNLSISINIIFVDRPLEVEEYWFWLD